VDLPSTTGFRDFAFKMALLESEASTWPTRIQLECTWRPPGIGSWFTLLRISWEPSLNEKGVSPRRLLHAVNCSPFPAHVALGPVVGPLGRVARGGRNWEGYSPDRKSLQLKHNVVVNRFQLCVCSISHRSSRRTGGKRPTEFGHCFDKALHWQ
jgi:hypothetical protein